MTYSGFAAVVRRGVIAWLVLLVLGTLLNAQNNRIYGGGGWFWLQYGGLMGLKPLADGLKAQGLSDQMPAGGIALGGGGGGYLGRVHIGGEGGSFLGKDVGGGGGWFRLGYLFPLGNNFLIMPVGMIGGGGLSFRIRERGAGVPFNQIGTATLPVRSLEAGGPITGGALEVQKNFGGFVLGLSVGYLSGLRWGDWETEEGVKVSGAPRITPGIPYLRLQIGGGGWRAGTRE